jgi:hypothetical protein
VKSFGETFRTKSERPCAMASAVKAIFQSFSTWFFAGASSSGAAALFQNFANDMDIFN